MLSRDDEEKLLGRLRAIGRPAAISELGDFGVGQRTLRRWLQRLCREGKARASGANRGCRYEAAPPAAHPAPAPPAEPAAALAALLRENEEGRAPRRTAEALAAERARRDLAPEHREAFVRKARQAIRKLGLRP